MPQLRIALAQVDATVGDLAGNTDLVLSMTRRAAAQGAHVVIFPEMVLTGYPVEDLALRPSFVGASRRAVDALARRLQDEGYGEHLVAVGYLDEPDGAAGGSGARALPHNSAALLHRGEVLARYAKHHLPNYGVFDEFRYFAPGARLPVVRFAGVDIAISICEDLWQDGGPVASVGRSGAGLLLVVNASPYELDKDESRLELVRRRALEAGCPLAYVNMVGGQDELVFDGDSMVVGADGSLLARAPQFEETLLVADLELRPATVPAADEATTESQPGGQRPIRIERVLASDDPVPSYEPATPVVASPLPVEGEVYAALVTGLRDYVRKNGFRSVVLGLSGGIDSALTAAIAVDAVGADSVHGVSMPSVYSSEHSRSDAAELAERTGLHFTVVAIAPMVQCFLDNLELTGLAEENLQARVRGTTLMGLSNQHGHLVLATGNKSELSVGYSTLYGDTVGGFAPLKDVPKTLVWRLARWRNDDAARRGQRAPIPENSISKPPSAELRPDQLDTDSLPSYDVLDELLDDYVELDRGFDDLVAADFDAALVERVLALVDTAEYKRRQYPPGPKITLKAFGRDRRLPITNRWRERTLPRAGETVARESSE